MSPFAQFFRPTGYALAAFVGLVGLLNIYWATTNSSSNFGVVGLGPDDLIGVDVSRVVFPRPDLAPEEVVRLQLAGLSDAKPDGIGILQCFCLASPGNRVVTGPLERFGQMVRSEPYQCMTHPHAVLIGRAQHGDDVARLLVTIIDEQHNVRAFAFVLSKQKEKPFENCWMTEAVLSAHPAPSAPLPAAPQA